MKLESSRQSADYMARNQALRDAAQDVCMVCGGRATGRPLRGPNPAGNYTHGDDLCPATAIWSRIHFESRVRTALEIALEYVRGLQKRDEQNA
jgi:hypothetical protein